MGALKSLRISFCDHRIAVAVFIVFLFGASVAWTQNIQIIKTSDIIAVINQGYMDGIQKGDYFVVRRLINNTWRDITYAEAIDARENMTGIKVLDIAPQISLTTDDVVEKVSLESESSMSSDSEPVQTADGGSAIQTNVPTSAWQRNTNWVYLGPAAGLFMPLGDMKELFDAALCYGGMLGFRFRRDLDMSLHFLYATKNQEWTFWNLQMLGRRYISQNFMLDFGYGVSYPEIFVSQGGGSFSSGNLRLGILLGAGYTFPVALTAQFEIGFLFHVYPHFDEGSGQFLTIQGRLVL
ncbi:hypothetical protein JW824_11225 [bacterium]|nr:hypothetical protein [bacterium]RQV92200.1 MAG: hypothetical protein EH221_11845 [bacterium]